MRTLVTVLPLKSQLSAKFQRFNFIDRSNNMLKNSRISKNEKLKSKMKIKNFKMFCEAQTAGCLKEII